MEELESVLDGLSVDMGRGENDIDEAPSLEEDLGEYAMLEASEGMEISSAAAGPCVESIGETGNPDARPGRRGTDWAIRGPAGSKPQ